MGVRVCESERTSKKGKKETGEKCKEVEGEKTKKRAQVWPKPNDEGWREREPVFLASFDNTEADDKFSAGRRELQNMKTQSIRNIPASLGSVGLRFRLDTNSSRLVELATSIASIQLLWITYHAYNNGSK